jgi:hypothetical protein
MRPYRQRRDDVAALVSAKVILAEMSRVQAEMDALLGVATH